MIKMTIEMTHYIEKLLIVYLCYYFHGGKLIQLRFQTIMKKRKKYVDTMDNAGRLLGQIAHRDEKVRFKSVNV